MAAATKGVMLDKIIMPTDVIHEVSRKVQEKSFVAALCPSVPETFTQEEYVTWTADPEGEFVGEGQGKRSSGFEQEPQVGHLHKFQVTVRMSDEVKWADEDGRLQIVSKLLEKMTAAKSRGLDYGLGHAIQPLDKDYIESFKSESIVWPANQVAATDDPVADLDNLPGLIIGDYDINGIALDRMYAYELRKVRNKTTGNRMFPEIGLDLQPGSVDGIRSVTSGSVAARRLAPTPTGIKAIMGDWGLVKWGFARDFAVELIEYGDPDGLGDLKRYNQLAYRTEAVFGWRVLDHKGFTVLRDKDTIPTTPTDDEDDDGGNDGGDDGGNVEPQSAKAAKSAAK